MSLLAEIRNEFSMRAVMRKVNSLLYESTERDKFVTVFYGLLDFKNRVLTFSNAGHNPPLLLRADGRTIQYLHEGGVALGVLPDARYEERPIALQPGDVLLLYTDGISEAESPQGEQFGTRRLEECLKSHREGSANEILKAIVDTTMAWAAEKGVNDDLTLVVVKAKSE
jgi:sigma-B regulation protein RsbU (phosphoserine phosphatase)